MLLKAFYFVLFAFGFMVLTAWTGSKVLLTILIFLILLGKLGLPIYFIVRLVGFLIGLVKHLRSQYRLELVKVQKHTES